MAVEIKQGDSYAIFINLVQDGVTLTPAMVDDLELYIGDSTRFSYLESSLLYDSASGQWYIWPTQEQTFSMEEGTYTVEVRVKYKNQNTTNVKGFKLNDKFKVISAVSREVL